ncbi:MAG: preprotein translocase subunit SecE [Eubacteriales bacterium]|nr:preprotein translocase subunit SecE [Eubacteriales bacterium]
MASIQDTNQTASLKIVRLIAVILLVIGLAACAASLYDLFSGYSLMQMLNPTEAAAADVATTDEAAATDDTAAEAAGMDVDGFAIGAAYFFLAVTGLLLVIGALMFLLKGKMRAFTNMCTAAIVLSVYPLIYFLLIIGEALMAIAFAAVCVAIIALSVLSIAKAAKVAKVRWMVYIKEMWGEVKKLSWLSKKDLAKHTLAVCIFVIVMGLVIWILDLGFGKGVQGLLSINCAPEATDEVPQDTTDETGDDTAADTDTNAD